MSMGLEEAKKLIVDSERYVIRESDKTITLKESEEIYEDDVAEWIINDTEKDVKEQIENFTSSILENFVGSKVLSISDTEVEDISYLKRKSGPSYSGTIFKSMKVSIPNSELTGLEEDDETMIIDEEEPVQSRRLSDVEWSCNSYKRGPRDTTIVFEMRAGYSRG